MKLLLTSAGVKNPSIEKALVDLLGKPVSQASALCIPTAQYAHPMVGPGVKPWQFVAGREDLPMVSLGWKSVGLLELTALPSLDPGLWEPVVRATDAFLVAGGDVLYLCHWLKASGLADLLPSLDAVWVGLSAGSMVMTPRVGPEFVQWTPPDAGDDTTLGLVDFSICPHLAPDGEPGNSLAEAQAWAAGIDGPTYAIDDDTAFAVVDGAVRVVSEGRWLRLS